MIGVVQNKTSSLYVHVRKWDFSLESDPAASDIVGERLLTQATLFSSEDAAWRALRRFEPHAKKNCEYVELPRVENPMAAPNQTPDARTIQVRSLDQQLDDEPMKWEEMGGAEAVIYTVR